MAETRGAGEPLLVAFGHHKAATTWLRDITLQIGDALGRRSSTVHNSRMVDGDLASWVTRNGIEILAYTNAKPEQVAMLPAHRGVHVIRDPRDIAVSAYFSHRNSHGTAEWPELVDHRRRLRAASAEEGLAIEIESSHRSFADMERWDYGRPNTLELRMEDLTTSPYEGWLSIARHWGVLDDSRVGVRLLAARLATRATHAAHRRSPLVPVIRRRQLTADHLLGIVHEHRFERKAQGRPPGQEDEDQHFRRGVAGDWRNHFTRRHATLFLECYPSLLETLGYEADDSWVDELEPSST